MARFTCAHIKKDNTICENNSCRKYTVSTTGCCPDHSSRFHSLNYWMRQKYGAEALQSKIPEAPISESDDSSASIHEHLFPTSSQLFADSLRRDLTDSIWIEILGDRVVINGSATESPRIYEDSVSESDDENMGLDLFGD
ncbi:hypothetical protein C1645_817048 [Glomus cerebriforme]|uniref:Uncharacterized protein n=1 Tax=Glomus cerebriforme TaxID=658196 RepID=A0A397TBD1_9GLOM|nr:hypothetical protein C1645_817048 [Glomus cerebriforme]